MQRPEYPTVEPSIETWEEACIISQEWADDARQAAVRHKQWVHWGVLIFMLFILLAVMSLYLILNPELL